MTDRRRLWSNGRVADNSLEGRVEAQSFVSPEPHRVVAVVADLCDAPGGARDRQVLRGTVFNCLEARDGWVFGYSEQDGYAGWVEVAQLEGHPETAPTHRVGVGRSYGKSTPGLKQMGHTTPLPHNAQLAVLDERDGWSRVVWKKDTHPADLFVPSRHLVPLSQHDDDPVEVAAGYWGTPYLWGGNSAFGIDCSGLVQAACVACGITCPGDSDMQAAELGVALPEDAPLQRGDLLFWKGHVAWVLDATIILHANAHHMAVAYEPMAEAIARIEAQGDGPVTARKRLEMPT